MNRYIFEKLFPGITKTLIFNFDFVKEVTQNDRDKLSKAWLRFLVENKDLNTLLSAKIAANELHYLTCPWDIDKKHAIAKTVREIITPEIFIRNDLYDKDSLVIEVVEKANKISYLPKQKNMILFACT